MRMRIAALCVILLFWGNVAEAWQAALTLKQLAQETCMQMVDYGEALLVETLEGLYMQWQRSIKKYCKNTDLCQVNGK